MLEPFHITREDLMVAQRDALMDHDRRVTEPMAEIATPRIAIVRRPERVLPPRYDRGCLLHPGFG